MVQLILSDNRKQHYLQPRFWTVWKDLQSHILSSQTYVFRNAVQHSVLQVPMLINFSPYVTFEI